MWLVPEMQENRSIGSGATLENVGICAPKALGPIIAGVVFEAQRDRFGGVIDVLENGHEDALDAFDLDYWGQRFDSLDFGQGAQIEYGSYVERLQRSNPGVSHLGGLGGAVEEI